MNTDYTTLTTKVEIYDNSINDLSVSIEAFDEYAAVIELNGVFNAHSFMQIVPHIAEALRGMKLEQDDYVQLDSFNTASAPELSNLTAQLLEMHATKKALVETKAEQAKLVNTVYDLIGTLQAYEPTIKKAGLLFGAGTNALQNARKVINGINSEELKRSS